MTIEDIMAIEPDSGQLEDAISEDMAIKILNLINNNQ